MTARHDVAAVVEDCEWMAQCGETLTRAAERLGYGSRDSLERTLGRAGRYDLVTKMKNREPEIVIESARINGRRSIGGPRREDLDVRPARAA